MNQFIGKCRIVWKLLFHRIRQEVKQRPLVISSFCIHELFAATNKWMIVSHRLLFKFRGYLASDKLKPMSSSSDKQIKQCMALHDTAFQVSESTRIKIKLQSQKDKSIDPSIHPSVHSSNVLLHLPT